jgi:hypothetical protein
MVQFGDVVRACLCFILSSADKKHLLYFDSVGDISFQNTSVGENSHYKGVEDGYGSLKFHHHGRSASKDEAAFFMDGFDPSRFMRTSQDSGAPPSKLNFAVAGNLTLSVDGAQVKCGNVRIGYKAGIGWKKTNKAWYIGGEQCQKTEIIPDIPKPGHPLYSLVCECDGSVLIEFKQKETGKPQKAGNHLFTTISDCTAVISKTSHWVQVGSSPGPQELQYSYGVDRSYEVTQTGAWSKSVSHSVTAGFSYDGAKLTTTVSHNTSQEYTMSHSSTFSTSQLETYSTQLPAGVAWQFHMFIEDNCGTSTVHMRDFQVTDSAANPPCCLPGYFINETDPLGDCMTVDGEVYNVCRDQDPDDDEDGMFDPDDDEDAMLV